MDKLKLHSEVDCAIKLQDTVRYWLKETRLKRFVRDILKINKLATITNRRHERKAFLKWKNIKVKEITTPKKHKVKKVNKKISEPQIDIMDDDNTMSPKSLVSAIDSSIITKSLSPKAVKKVLNVKSAESSAVK